MSPRLLSVVFLLSIPAASFSVANVDADRSCCAPSFREVSDTPIRANIGYWKIDFSVALVGCAEDLKEITDEERHLLIKEFKEPAQWSNLRLLSTNGGRNADFRTKAVARTNHLLGRDLVADILFHSITGYDHHIQLDSERDSAEES